MTVAHEWIAKALVDAGHAEVAAVVYDFNGTVPIFQWREMDRDPTLDEVRETRHALIRWLAAHPEGGVSTDVFSTPHRWHAAIVSARRLPGVAHERDPSY